MSEHSTISHGQFIVQLGEFDEHPLIGVSLLDFFECHGSIFPLHYIAEHSRPATESRSLEMPKGHGWDCSWFAQ